MGKPTSIKNEKNILKNVKVFSFLDNVRWQSSDNYNMINYSSEDLNADEKLLTHWLCYVMDRQMPFMRIWDIGGYVISYIVRQYKNEKTARETVNTFIQIETKDSKNDSDKKDKNLIYLVSFSKLVKKS